MGVAVPDDNIHFADDQASIFVETNASSYMLYKLKDDNKKLGMNINLSKT